MRLYFIRHGQSVNNLLWEETGSNRGRSTDPELTEMGHRQASYLAEYLQKKDSAARSNGGAGVGGRDFFGFTHLYTSLMVRAVATGTYISQALGLPLVGWPEIHECGGIYIDDVETGKPMGLLGMTRSHFASNYSHLVLPDAATEEGWWNRDFEADADRPVRARQVLETLLERHGGTDDQVAIISHGGFYMELARILFQVKNEKSWFLMNNTAVSCFDFWDGGVTLYYHNRTDHLPEHMIT